MSAEGDEMERVLDVFRRKLSTEQGRAEFRDQATGALRAGMEMRPKWGVPRNAATRGRIHMWIWMLRIVEREETTDPARREWLQTRLRRYERLSRAAL